ncbi:hypothetical protein BS78_03G019800 [Paspalum vaginatum]|nr:hypothetical protein BS78_03G019800 [Paspalum vaginatum]
MSSPSSVPWSAPPLYDDGGSAGPLTPRQQRALSLSARVLLAAIAILAVLTIVLGFLRFCLCQFVPRGSGGLAVGVRRSFDSLGASVRRGLDASALAALPVTVYHSRKPDGGSGGDGKKGSSSRVTSAECAVCLSELADGAMVRALPSCGHVFHVECVDAWLRSRTTCPVCRAEVRASAPAPLLGAGDNTLAVTVQCGTVQDGGAQAESRRPGTRAPSMPVIGFGQPAGATGT